jgi:hypothetical protein
VSSHKLNQPLFFKFLKDGGDESGIGIFFFVAEMI